MHPRPFLAVITSFDSYEPKFPSSIWCRDCVLLRSDIVLYGYRSLRRVITHNAYHQFPLQRTLPEQAHYNISMIYKNEKLEKQKMHGRMKRKKCIIPSCSSTILPSADYRVWLLALFLCSVRDYTIAHQANIYVFPLHTAASATTATTVFMTTALM